MLGFVSLLVSFALVFSDKSLSLSQKIGQMATTLLGFGITSYVIAAAVAASPIGLGLTVMISVLVAVTMAVSTLLINAYYFSSAKAIDERIAKYRRRT